MTTVTELLVEVRGKDVNVERLLRQVQQQLRQTEAAGARTASALGTQLVSGQQRAANSALQPAAAQARLAVAQGSNARGLGILNTALTANAGASERAIVGV